MEPLLRDGVARYLDTDIRSARPLSGGCVGEVYRLELEDGRRAVAKVDRGARPRLDIEGYMLRYLREHSALPVPEVYGSEPGLLLMEYLVGDSHFDGRSQVHAAELLSALHGVRGAAFGLERSTLIGGLHQPNKSHEGWIDFFRDERLLYMAREAAREGRLDGGLLGRFERFAADLERYLIEPEGPALLHGDVWTTNVLASGGRITGFIDPAIYYGHPEIELAFTTLFGTFGDTFYRAYAEHSPIAPGFFEVRRDIYNLYPLLVHVRLFGGGYGASAASILARLGY